MLKLWELAPSPNNLKVWMALRFKGIPFETASVDPRDRKAVLAVSGQELTPVIEDRGIVLNDSEAILHYLDANYRDLPRLYPSSGDGRRECDAFDARLDRDVASGWLPVFLYGIGVQPSYDDEDRTSYRDGLRRLDAELGGKDSFRPEAPVCDLRVAVWASYAIPGPRLLKRVPLFGKFKELFAIPESSLPNLSRFMKPWDEKSGA